MIENDTTTMDQVFADKVDLYDEHMSTGNIIAENIDGFHRGMWKTHVQRHPLPKDLGASPIEYTHDDAMAALGRLEATQTDVDAIRRMIVDVGIIAGHVFVREGKRHYGITEVSA